MKYTIGIDEVGRGSLAGPVVVSAVALPRGLRVSNSKLGKLRDSKKLSAKKREAWVEYFKNHQGMTHATARVYPKTIDGINISRAANLAAFRASARLIENRKLKSKNCRIFLDGGLFLGNGKERDAGKTVIRGDENITAIKIASILAKVYRDGLMKRLAKKYPKYGFEIHKGYGTRIHMRAIKKYGPSEVHRLTFV